MSTWGAHLEVELLNRAAVLCLVSSGNLTLFSIRTDSVFSSYQQGTRPPIFPHSVQYLQFFFLTDIRHSNGCETASHWGFNLHFPKDYCLAICTSWQKCVFKFFSHFINQVSVALYTLDMKPFPDIGLENHSTQLSYQVSARLSLHPSPPAELRIGGQPSAAPAHQNGGLSQSCILVQHCISHSGAELM